MNATDKIIRWQRITIAFLLIALTTLTCHYCYFRQQVAGVNFDDPAPPTANTPESAAFVAQGFVRTELIRQGFLPRSGASELLFPIGRYEASRYYPNGHPDGKNDWQAGGEVYARNMRFVWSTEQNFAEDHTWQLTSIKVDAKP